MILWLNGTFGVGKTTTGTLLAETDPTWRLFDPEWVGFMLAHNLADQPVTDFQQLPSWRTLVPVVADEVARFTGQSLVAVQSVLVEDYWDELEAGLRRLGHELVHVVLEADVATMRTRIDADEVERTAHGWRHRHLEVYADARAWMTDRADLVVDTTHLTPEQAAAAVRAFISR